MKFLLLLLLLTGCFSGENKRPAKTAHVKKEKISRLHNEKLFTLRPPEKRTLPTYPWEIGQVGQLPIVTKEYFRCRGCTLNPSYPHIQNGETLQIFDCGGTEKHSLPLRNGKEFVYPILIDLLNHIQLKTGKKVIITSGHRCPQHNTYIDPSKTNSFSKHQIAAEVSFYVQGFENRPEIILKHIQDYYLTEKYKGQKDFEFQRYEKKDTDVSTPPWYNKEIFIKLYKKQEGRNFDNRHSHPYLSIQVRYDSDLKERVIYSWDKANKNYLRN